MTGLILAIETSSANYSFAVGTSASIEVLESTSLHEAPQRDIRTIVADALRRLGAGFPEIERIAVDVGPGNLSSVRAGAAYANGLAFSLGLPVFCVDSLELLADTALARNASQPVLCLRKGGGQNVYAALADRDRPRAVRYGVFAATVADLAGGLRSVSVAGSRRHEVKEIVPQTAVTDTEVEAPDVTHLYERVARAQAGAAEFQEAATPLTEASSMFRCLP